MSNYKKAPLAPHYKELRDRLTPLSQNAHRLLRWLRYNTSIFEIAKFLCLTEDEVKAAAIELTEKHLLPDHTVQSIRNQLSQRRDAA